MHITAAIGFSTLLLGIGALAGATFWHNRGKIFKALVGERYDPYD